MKLSVTIWTMSRQLGEWFMFMLIASTTHTSSRIHFPSIISRPAPITCKHLCVVLTFPVGSHRPYNEQWFPQIGRINFGQGGSDASVVSMKQLV